VTWKHFTSVLFTCGYGCLDVVSIVFACCHCFEVWVKSRNGRITVWAFHSGSFFPESSSIVILFIEIKNAFWRFRIPGSQFQIALGENRLDSSLRREANEKKPHVEGGNYYFWYQLTSLSRLRSNGSLVDSGNDSHQFINCHVESHFDLFVWSDIITS